MTKDEAARILDPDTTREALAAYAYDPEQRIRVVEEACRIAARELRKNADHFREVTKMVPLTLEQLREMDGKPVWVERNEKPHDGKWFIVSHADIKNPDKTLYTKEGVTYSNYGVYFTAYAYPPAHIDREAWEKPCKICNGEKTLYQSTYSTKLFMDKFGESTMLVTEHNACPPYADCAKKRIHANSAFQINYCPECGRPLTHEAWEALEKRLRGE